MPDTLTSDSPYVTQSFWRSWPWTHWPVVSSRAQKIPLLCLFLLQCRSAIWPNTISSVRYW